MIRLVSAPHDQFEAGWTRVWAHRLKSVAAELVEARQYALRQAQGHVRTQLRASDDVSGSGEARSWDGTVMQSSSHTKLRIRLHRFTKEIDRVIAPVWRGQAGWTRGMVARRAPMFR